MIVTLYTRQGCHLCDQAEQVLHDFGLEVTCVDIDADESLRQQFDCCVPVVVMDDKIRFRGKVDPVLLRRIVGRDQP